MNRRGFLGSILAIGAAPAIVRASSLMRVQGIIVPTLEEVVAVNSGNQLLTANLIIQQALRFLEENMQFCNPKSMGSKYLADEIQENVIRINQSNRLIIPAR